MKTYHTNLSLTDDQFDLIYDALRAHGKNKKERITEINDLIDELYEAMEDAGESRNVTTG
jgi:hypothetical protein